MIWGGMEPKKVASPGSSSSPLKTCSHREVILPNGLPKLLQLHRWNCSWSWSQKNDFTSEVKPCQTGPNSPSFWHLILSEGTSEAMLAWRGDPTRAHGSRRQESMESQPRWPENVGPRVSCSDSNEWINHGRRQLSCWISPSREQVGK